MRDDRERLKDNTRVAGDWHKQIAAGAAFTLLEYAVGLDEFAETALQCPAVEVQAFDLAGLFDRRDRQSGFVRSQQGSDLVEFMLINTSRRFVSRFRVSRQQNGLCVAQ